MPCRDRRSSRVAVIQEIVDHENNEENSNLTLSGYSIQNNNALKTQSAASGKKSQVTPNKAI